MNLFEYIKSQLPQMPNVAIMRQLGASEELIEYIRETPWNTNFAIAEVIEGSGDGGEDTGEVWFAGNEYNDQEGARIFTPLNINVELDEIEYLLLNNESYIVYLNGVELPYYAASNSVMWSDAEGIGMTKQFNLSLVDEEIVASAIYIGTSTAPTSVEVSIKAK